MEFQEDLMINGRLVGKDHAPYVIAEMSGNHEGELKNALALIDAAADCGADAVKIQTYTADTMTVDCDDDAYRLNSGLWAGKSLYQLYQEAHTPWGWHEALFERAKQKGITLFSSPFDATAVDFLESLDCPAYKIASFEIIDFPLLEKVAATGKPMIISTGMAELSEIEEALHCVKKCGANQVAILHCVSGYPTPLEECNLRTMVDLAQKYAIPVGLSDHTKRSLAASVAVALGACVVEKHFKVSDDSDAVDAAFSLSPCEFKALVGDLRDVSLLLGKVDYSIKPSEIKERKNRRSIIAKRNIKVGEKFTEENVACLRPSIGLHPRYTRKLMGCVALRDISLGEGLNESDLGA